MEELRTQQETELELLQQLWDTNMEELVSSFRSDRSAAPQRPLLGTEGWRLHRGILGNVGRLLELDKYNSFITKRNN